MKRKITLWRRSAALVAATALFQAGARVQAQVPDLAVNTFDSDTSINGFWDWWGAIQNLFEWDGTVDAGGSTNASSGSVKLSIVFDNTNGDNQYCYGMSLSGVAPYNADVVANPAAYTALEFDIRWDTANTIAVDQFNNSAGDQNFFMGFAGTFTSAGGTPAWGGDQVSWISPGPPLTGDGAWQHVSIPIAPTRPGFAGLAFKKWQPTSANGLNGTVTVWLDNIKLIGSTTPPPPPTLNVQRSDTTGVQITASGGNQYQRQSIAATSAEAQATGWVDNPDPVTYSLTIADMPRNPSFQVHLFLSPDSGGANSPDWNDPNVVFLDIRQNADGTGFATFRYKTNTPANNDMLYFQNGFPFDGRLATLSPPSALGTWSLRFEGNTNITLSGPGDTSTNFTMLPEHAEFFRAAAGMTASFGVQPNQPSLIGSSATFSRIRITSGATTVVDDAFTTAFDPTQVNPDVWTRRMDDPNGIAILLQSGFLVTWGVPDSGFVLRASSNLVSGWYTPSLPIGQIGSTKRVLVAGTNLPSPAQGYFQLINTNTP